MTRPTHTTPADGNVFLDMGFKEPEASQLRVEAEARLAKLREECEINPVSSRMCQVGTKGCITEHVIK